jgi:hypothetical protein
MTFAACHSYAILLGLSNLPASASQTESAIGLDQASYILRDGCNKSSASQAAGSFAACRDISVT